MSAAGPRPPSSGGGDSEAGRPAPAGAGLAGAEEEGRRPAATIEACGDGTEAAAAGRQAIAAGSKGPALRGGNKIRICQSKSNNYSWSKKKKGCMANKLTRQNGAD